MTGTSRAWIIAVTIGGTSLSGQPHLPEHRHPRPMSRVREFRSRRHRPPVSYHQSDDDTDYDPHDDTDYDPHDNDDDDDDDSDYDPHDDDDDSEYERAVLRAKRLHNMVKCERYRAEHREKLVASKKKYRENNREFIAVSSQCYREKRRKQVLRARKRYRAKYPQRVAETNKRYRERNRTKLREKQRRYRERNRAKLREAQRRYREKNLEHLLACEEQYRETHREVLREKERCRRARLAEKKRTQEKMEALGPLTLTINLTDYLKSISVTQESVDTNGPPRDSHTLIDLDSGESVDTNGPPTDSHTLIDLDSGESVDTKGPPRDSHSLIDLDSGGVQVADSPDWENVSYLQELLNDMSPDDWQQVMNDVEEFHLEALLPPEDLVHDMSYDDEGVDLLFDFMS